MCFSTYHAIFRSLIVNKILQGEDPYFNKLIRILATRCMTQVILIECSKPENFFSFYVLVIYDLFPLSYRQYISVVAT